MRCLTKDRQTQGKRGMSHNALERQTERERGVSHNGQADTAGTWNVSQWTGRHRGNVKSLTMDRQTQRERGKYHNGQADTEGTWKVSQWTGKHRGNMQSHNVPAIRDRHPRDDAHRSLQIQIQTSRPSTVSIVFQRGNSIYWTAVEILK